MAFALCGSIKVLYIVTFLLFFCLFVCLFVCMFVLRYFLIALVAICSDQRLYENYKKLLPWIYIWKHHNL